MVFLDPVLNPAFQPLMNKSPFLAILILSFVISVIITLVYKYFTNQNEMKRLKEQQKEFQTKLKGLRSNPDEMMKVQKEAMKVNMEYMKHSFKPTLITMLPILLIFGWMGAHLGFEQIYPSEPFSVTADFAKGITGEVELVVPMGTELLSEAKQIVNDGEATWNLKSSVGEKILTIKTEGTQENKKVLITKELKYEPAISNYEHSEIEKITINYDKLKPLADFKVPLFNWQPGWLGVYIIFSIVFSISLRKVLKLH